MEWLEDVMRWLEEAVFNEHVVHTILHMGLEAFKHFVKHNAPHIWRAFSGNIAAIFDFVKDWLSGN
jgi:hypothetical protein